MTHRKTLLIGATLLALSACSAHAALPPAAGFGPRPQLPEPRKQLIPKVKIAPAVGWPAGAAPTAAPGFAVRPFATGLTHPRWLYRLPNGDVLVAETNGPPEKPRDIKGWVMGKVMKKAGAGVPSPERITLLRDADGDGVAETRQVFLSGLRSPFGMVLVGDTLFVADTDAVLAFDYRPGATSLSGPGRKVADLPAFPIDHHWTKNIIANREGTKLYVTVGSNSNVGENGLDKEVERAAILEMNLDGSGRRIFASGLRNPNGLAWQPQSGQLWTTVNERDEIGDDLVPDYMTSVRDGGFYGWPFSWYGQHVDTRIKEKDRRPDLVARAIVPDYALGSHTASLGLAFDDAGLFPARYRNGAFIGQHGSWNRGEFNGYQVIFVPFAGGMPSGPAEPVLTGFLDDKGQAMGRPVGVILDKAGALLVADDVGNTVWRVTPAA
ncbi:glucose/arabinose dehydrogenase [Caulobacter ginsengisoli]|uniref:Glucose/arabinose dehydrogenase n=1 Tax=Caulobacter ginsengisoli TaxID=400775 RepID=A0ABU0J029_9CAUL|nr:sorbosone dehydrogenase family protein [Caulobacter ginsengisoli]MDQ0466783.1 glucose/arabinose dehydrogenase [Caulobacter ginsengisoli]